MLCAVHYRWREDGRHWTDTFTYYINIKDGDIKRAAKVIRKRFGNLEEGWLQIKDDMARFGIESDTFYRFIISPITVRDM